MLLASQKLQMTVLLPPLALLKSSHFLGPPKLPPLAKKETSKVPTGNETSWISNGDEKKCSSCLSFSLIIIIIKEAMQIFLGTSIGIGGAAIPAGIQEERMPN